jgi:hypothetical protein
MQADGSLSICRRGENPELFRLAIGGTGCSDAFDRQLLHEVVELDLRFRAFQGAGMLDDLLLGGAIAIGAPLGMAKTGVCTENSILIDYVIESPNVSGDDRAVPV